MDPKQQQQIKQYLNIILRWKKLILSCFLASLVVGLGMYLKSPKVYRAEALLVYQRGKINPSNKLTPDLSSQIREVLATLQDQVLSRSSLEELIVQFQLYQEALGKLPMEDVIDRMRSNNIEVIPSKGDTFTVAFKGKVPRKVMLVANALASKFVEENLRFREERATETSAYIQDELTLAQKTIEEKETAMRDYKLRYYNEMPDQRQTNITRLNALQNTYQDIQGSLQELERTKIMVQEQITLRKNYLAQADSDSQALLAMGQNQNPEAFQQRRRLADQLNAERTELTSLAARYTEQHPEIKRLKKTIAQLEEQLKASSNSSKAEQQQDGTISEGEPSQIMDSQLVKLELQLKEIELSMAQLKKEREEAKKQIETYQKWIAAAPTREAEWAGLTRDYEQLRQRYQDLVSSNLSAASVETLERKQKGSQFKVLDSARLPEKPFKPDLKKILLMAIFVGLGFGCSVAFCIEFIDSSFKEAHDLEKYLDVPIVCSIPAIQTVGEKKKKTFRNLFWSACFFAVLLTLTVGSFYLWKKGILII